MMKSRLVRNVAAVLIVIVVTLQTAAGKRNGQDAITELAYDEGILLTNIVVSHEGFQVGIASIANEGLLIPALFNNLKQNGDLRAIRLKEGHYYIKSINYKAGWVHYYTTPQFEIKRKEITYIGDIVVTATKKYGLWRLQSITYIDLAVTDQHEATLAAFRRQNPNIDPAIPARTSLIDPATMRPRPYL